MSKYSIPLSVPNISGNCQSYNIQNSKKLTEISFCLPSSSNLTNENLDLVVSRLSE